MRKQSVEKCLEEFHSVIEENVRKGVTVHGKETNHKRTLSNLDNKQLMELWESLFLEELREFGTAYDAKYPEGILKEACDVVYVLVAWIEELGLEFDAPFNEVHRNNMAKFPEGKISLREDGKILKPEGFKPISLEKYVKRAQKK